MIIYIHYYLDIYWLQLVLKKTVIVDFNARDDKAAIAGQRMVSC